MWRCLASTLLCAPMWFSQEVTGEEIDKVVQAFLSSNASDREAGQDKLDRLGLEARISLEKWKSHPDGELRARVVSQLAFLDSLQECKTNVSMFTSFDVPNLHKLQFVRFATPEGPPFRKQALRTCLHGWLIGTTGDGIRLWRHFGIEEYTFAKPMEGPARNGPEVSIPTPGRYVTLDFRKVCADLARGDTPLYVLNEKDGLGAEAILCLYAHWALEFRMNREAVRLLERAKIYFDDRTNGDKGQATSTIWQVVVRDVASSLRMRTILDAATGAPFRSLKASWHRIARLPPHSSTVEAEVMTASYALLADSEASDASKKVSSFQREVALLVRRIPEANGTLVVSVSGGRVEGNTLLDSVAGLENPLLELRKLGWGALPFLIAKLDDRTPTRCILRRRSLTAVDHVELLRVGDCCDILLWRISGMTFGDVLLYKAESTPDRIQGIKNAAIKWWEVASRRGPREHYLALFKNAMDGPTKGIACRGLVNADGKYLGEILGSLEQPSTSFRVEILSEIDDLLNRESIPDLTRMLADGDVRFVMALAEVLWKRFGIDTGVKELTRRLKNDRSEDGTWLTYRLLTLLDESMGETAHETVLSLLSDVQSPVGTITLGRCQLFPDLRIAEVLAGHLSNKAEEPSEGPLGEGLRVCDRAAQALDAMMGFPARFDPRAESGNRDVVIDYLKQWWVKNRELVDWKRLREGKARK